MMRWSNKIMSYTGDKSESKLSSRSLSKFKKVDLQKQDEQIASNTHLQRSQLKLTSVEKIKLTHGNKCNISNFVNMSGHDDHSRSIVNNKDKQKVLSKYLRFQEQRAKNLPSQKSEHVFNPGSISIFQQSGSNSPQGFSVFKQESAKKYQIEEFTTRSQVQKDIHFQKSNLEEGFKSILSKLREVFEQFKTLTESIKKQLNEDKLSAFVKLQQSLITYAHEFQNNLEVGIKQVLVFISRQKKKQQPTVSNKFENFVKTDQFNPPSPDNESFCKIKTFEHQLQEQVSKPSNKNNRPSTFKNKFKQIVKDSQENFIIKNHTQDTARQSQNRLKKLDPQQQKQQRKLSRKRTNPVPRINSLVSNESSAILTQNASNSQIRYCKVNQRSASKSVKKLYDKIVLIKNIFNSTSSSTIRYDGIKKVDTEGGLIKN